MSLYNNFATLRLCKLYCAATKTKSGILIYIQSSAIVLHVICRKDMHATQGRGKRMPDIEARPQGRRYALASSNATSVTNEENR